MTAALFTMFGFVPQVYKVLHTKSVKDVSVVTLIQFSRGVFLWMLYGMHRKEEEISLDILVEIV